MVNSFQFTRSTRLILASAREQAVAGPAWVDFGFSRTMPREPRAGQVARASYRVFAVIPAEDVDWVLVHH